MTGRVLIVALLAALCFPAGAQTQSGPDNQIMTACIEAAQSAMIGETGRLEDCIGALSGPCMESPEGSTTVGTNECLGAETQWWDAFLNARYDALRKGMDGESALALRNAQRAWIAFRDAECELHYTYWREGTIRSTIYAICMQEMTASRAVALAAPRWVLE
ncbi:lysozyme inhibitor LprI family protein [Pelagibacterium sediminicola]|uniref:lysozyme inhibitor LprI family protein n=1 Tax=Pelagibacterium sediminicola TaxID=2248761 RepID=UPI001300649F|nr:lysozyme inhibitor LprI family protein [Pelagibacterium sediminicola]